MSRKPFLVAVLVAGGILVPAGMAQAHGANDGSSPGMHQMQRGNPGVQPMNENMQQGNPGMRRMHELMCGDVIRSR